MSNSFKYVLAIIFFITIFLPGEIFGSEEVDIKQYQVLPDNKLVGITVSSGFVISSDGGKTWDQRNNGLPLKVVYPFAGNEYRRLTSLYVDPLDTERIAVTDSSTVFISSDGGWNWLKVETGGPVKTSNYFTSVSLDPMNRDRIILGTSFNGIFETKNSGKIWEKLPADLADLYRGAGFYEEISGLAIDPYNSDRIFISAGFSNKVFTIDSSDKKLVPFEGIELLPPSTIKGFDIKKTGIGVYTNNSYYYKDNDNDYWDTNTYLFNLEKNTTVPEDIDRLVSSMDKTGLYVNSFYGSGERLDSHIAFMKNHGLNSMVIDMKDDEGILTYATSLELPLEIGAVRKRIDIDQLLKKAKENGIYVIGRIVVFKDPKLYNYSDNSYSIWNNKTGTPWGNLMKETNSETGEETWIQKEFWVDPFSEFVWRYNIAIAEELQNLGVDEIQFDYIRFPSDGNLKNAVYRSRREGMSKIDAIESFMRIAREKIFIPISTDLYGFNSWYRMGNWIGQNIEMLADYVDVISPMYYPSHFPSDFLKDMDYLSRAKFIYSEGTRRARIITENRSLIRPYVQAFLIGHELNMEYEEYTRYLDLQIEGLTEAGGSGYTMWNNSNRYYMVAD